MGLENGAYAPFSVCKVYFIDFMVMIRIAIGNTSTRFDFVCNFKRVLNVEGYSVASAKLYFTEKMEYN